MSGGVDSSVAAALLKEEGYNVVGVFFKPWAPDDGTQYCNWREDRQDALRVAAKIGIKFQTWDFSKEYGKKVTKYMIDSYRQGMTPNPDIACNKEIKFGLFLKRTLAEGADFIATGHYARIKKSGGLLKLLKGVDKNKDQSYFLYTLSQKELKYCLFPIGGYTKPEVRRLAEKFGLPNYDKKDSQGVCFVGQLDMKTFLKNYIKPRPGPVKLISSGKTISRHDGVYYYTIGQRHGLNLGIAGGPYFVAGKDLKKNTIYVAGPADTRHLMADKMSVSRLSWVNGKPKLPSNCFVKIRYRSESIAARLSAVLKGGKLTVHLRKSARAITPGQSAVFYNGEAVIGGGIIF